MWKRNVLFLALVSGGVIALTASLFPSPVPPHAEFFDPEPFRTSDFQGIVRQVDAAFREEWAREKLQPAPRAEPLVLARRASLALTGRIPSLQEVRQFEARSDEQRLAWWVAGLLQDRRHADYFAERFARTYVGTEDGPFLIFRRRRFVSWLSDELLNNTPYHVLVQNLITAKGLWTNKPETNFITVTFDNVKPNRPNPERLAGRVSRGFLGIRLDCAQCHDHPFERWSQRDFQGLAAFFAQIEQGFSGIQDGQGELEHEDRKSGKKEVIEPSVPFLTEQLPEHGTRRERLAAWVTSPKNPYFARAAVNRVWALMFGRPLVEPVDNIPTDKPLPPALTLLADDFAAHGYDLRRLIQVIAATEVFQLDSASDRETTEAHEKAWALFPITRLRPEQVIGSIAQAASLETINSDSHILVRLAQAIGQNEFLKRYGDTGEDEFDARTLTIPQRLLLMNGDAVKEATKESLFNSSTRISMLAPDDRTAVEIAYLVVLTRRPSPEEAEEFERRLAGSKGTERHRRLEDLFWTLMNVSEFACNH
jgi:hypothetical protein